MTSHNESAPNGPAPEMTAPEKTPPSPLARISDATIDPREVERAVWTTADGAMVTFNGIVRDHDGDRTDVVHIEYSAHPKAADILAALCVDIAAEATEASGPAGQVRVGAVHRTGVLPVGEVAVVAVAVAPHRAEAFAACSELIERLKHEVPIWKRQLFSDGLSEWVGVGDC